MTYYGPIQRRSLGATLKPKAALAVAAICAIWAAASQNAHGAAIAAPERISYQGTLTLADGTEPVSGVQDIEFRLYKNETDQPHEAIWAERHSSVRISSGIFNVYLGGGDPIDGLPAISLAQAFASPPLWLGIKVGLDDEMTQRQKILSIPYAMTVSQASTATNGVPAGTIVAFAGQRVPEGWLLCDGAALSKTEYSALYNALKNPSGNCVYGETADTFILPNLARKTPIGSGTPSPNNDGSGLIPSTRSPGDAIATSSESVLLSESQIPAHTHTITDRWENNSRAWNGVLSLLDIEKVISPDIVEHKARNTSPNPVSGSFPWGVPNSVAHNNMQPSTYVKFIIKY